MNAKQITLTLVLYLTLALTLATANASHDARREHAHLKRILRKRATAASESATPSGLLGPLIGAGQAPAATGAATSTPAATASTPTTPDSASSTDGGLLNGIASGVSNLLSASASSGSSSVSAASSSSSLSALSSSVSLSSSSSLSSATSTPPATSTPASAVASTQVVQGKVTRTMSVGAQETSAQPVAQSSAAKTKNMTVTILIAVGASLGGIVILWTIFRKWKLSRSSKDDPRMQPIDWQPTNANDALPGELRRHSGSSFRSGLSGFGAGSDDGHASSHGHGSNHLGPLPAHDFTAGPATVGGYADLARGPSPQPQMQDLSRGPSLTRPNYDAQVPLHHQGGGYGQDAYNYRY